jgi:chemotaxis protein CheZ
MTEKKTERENAFYQDISRITLMGLSDITKDFEEFYKEMTARFQPVLNEMTRRELPEASDQLNAVVETTEAVATRVMDALEDMQDEHQRITQALGMMRQYKRMAADKREALDRAGEASALCQVKIMNIIEEMSFQDLTGQRIKRIVTLVQSVEKKVKKILTTLDQKLPESSKPAPAETQKAEPELKGPQREGEGLDQSAIDELLASL